MPTGNEIVLPALKLLGVLAQGESPSSSESDDARVALNSMLSNWSAEKLNVFQRTIFAGVLTNGINSYTIGSGMTFNTARPVKITGANNLISNVRTPVEVIPQEAWSGIVDQTTTGPVVKALYFNQSEPTGTVFLYPTPNGASTLELYIMAQLPSFSDLVTNVSIAAQYTRAMIYNLAVEIASSYGAALRPEIMAIANESKAVLRKLNAETMGPDPATGATSPISAAAPGQGGA